MVTLRLGRREWHDLAALLARDSTAGAVGPTGIERTAGGTRVLARSLRSARGMALGEWWARLGDMLVVAALESAGPDAAYRFLAAHGLLEARRVTLVLVGSGRLDGHIAGAYASGGIIEPLDALEVVGPGLPRWSLAAPRAAGSEPGALAPPERYSRAAAGMTIPAWTRLGELSVALVGCGRSGSLAAEALARMGVARLVLIDHDRVEEGNLDAMVGAGPRDVGRAKTAVVARAIRWARPDFDLETIERPAESPEAGRALRHADVIITAVDRDTPRLAAAEIASAYLRPHVDLGTRIDRGRGRRWMGLDVRLCLPGEGCVRCVAGLADEAGARAALRARAAPAGGGAAASGDTPATRHWSDERAGSLMGLNMAAVGRALGLLADLLEGRLRQSRWSRVLWDEDSREEPQDLDATRAPDCPVCAIAGQGDYGLGEG